MYLLKRDEDGHIVEQDTNSHSTMYLLKLYYIFPRKYLCQDSHSTMYLLKLDMLKPLKVSYAIHIPPCIY